MTMLDKFMARHKPCKGKTLVVGSKVYGAKIDRRALYSNSVGLDMVAGFGVDIVHDLEEPLKKSLGVFQHVDCCSVLEHVRHPWVMAENIERVLEQKGTILISVPFVWRVHGYPSDYWRITPAALPILFPRIKWRETGYITEDAEPNMAPTVNLHGQKWLQRTEVVGFGVRR
jgi:SAM-dependent methyltransferase